MKKLLSTVFTLAICLVACHDHGVAAEHANIAGKWQLSMDTPHGLIKGPFQVQQDGTKLTATFETEMFGSMSATGTVDGNNVSFSLKVPGGPQTFGFTGTVSGQK